MMIDKYPANENRCLDEFGIDPDWMYVCECVDNVVDNLLKQGMYRSTVFRALEFALFELLQASNPTKGHFLADCTDVSAILSDLKELWGLRETVTNITANYEIALERLEEQLAIRDT